MRPVTSGGLSRSGSQLVQGCCARALVTRAAAAARWPRLSHLWNKIFSFTLQNKRTDTVNSNTLTHSFQNQAPLHWDRKKASDNDVLTVFLFWAWIFTCLSFSSLSARGNGRENLFGEGAARVREGSLNTDVSSVGCALMNRLQWIDFYI